MIKETLKNGFEVEIPDENLDDYELLEDLAALDEGEENTGKIVSAYKRLLGALIGADYPQSITAELFENITNNQAEGHGNTAVYESKEEFMKARYGGEK